MKKKWSLALFLGLMVGISTNSVFAQNTASTDTVGYSRTSEVIKSITLPEIKEPEWLTKQKIAEQQSNSGSTSTGNSQPRTFIYSVEKRGNISVNFSEFQQQVSQSLNDPRGWSRMGISFRQVASGGQFTLVLAEASQLPAFSSGCSIEYSCRVGQYVIINQDRWSSATPSWNNAGGNLRDYRHMVINHEVGHWLGHDHEHCGGAGKRAPVMQQQSIDLEGCTFNPWPLTSELTTTR